MLQTTKMRLPTCKEWDSLSRITGGNNKILNWAEMYSWCQDSDLLGMRMVKGRSDCRFMRRIVETERSNVVGFRPVFEADPRQQDGDIVLVGTLYMNDEPVKVPKQPLPNGDIQDYVPGATLRLGQPMVDPDYQIMAIKVGDILIADRVLLKNISWPETGGALPLFFVTEANDVDATSEVIAVARTRDEAWLEMYRAFVCRIELLNSIDEAPDGPHPLPIPSKEEARAGWGRTLDGVWGYISLDHASIVDDGGTTGFSISEFALDRNLLL